MKLSDQIQIIVKHIVEIPALLSGFRKNHGQMQGNRPHVKSAYKYRRIRLIRRMHAAPLIPGRKEGTASHRGNHLAILLIHAGNIAFPGQTQPVGIHGFPGTFDSRFKYVLQFFSRPVKIFIVEKYQLWKQHGLLTAFLPLPLSSHLQHGDGGHLRKFPCPCPKGHGNKRVIPAAGGYGIKFVLPALYPLFQVTRDIFHGFFFRPFLTQPKAKILLFIFYIGFLCIGLQNFFHTGHSKSAVLLTCGT